MMVRVDQPRQNDVIFEVKHLIGCRWKFTRRPNLLDEAAANKKATIGNLPLMVIHSNNVGIFDEEGSHVVEWFVCGIVRR
jgi:hypothetical protein